MLDEYLKYKTTNINVCWEYLYNKFKLSIVLLTASTKALVHAFIPSFYVTSTTDTIAYIDNEIKTNGCGKSE